MTYFEPHDAGPDSEPIEAGKRIARLDEEMLRWLKTGPEKVVLYVKHPTADKGWRVTTWLGTVVGTAYCTVRYRIGFGGGYRRAICTKLQMEDGSWWPYHGWYYESSGDYCRLRRGKRK